MVKPAASAASPGRLRQQLGPHAQNLGPLELPVLLLGSDVQDLSDVLVAVGLCRYDQPAALELEMLAASKCNVVQNRASERTEGNIAAYGDRIWHLVSCTMATSPERPSDHLSSSGWSRMLGGYNYGQSVCSSLEQVFAIAIMKHAAGRMHVNDNVCVVVRNLVAKKTSGAFFYRFFFFFLDVLTFF